MNQFCLDSANKLAAAAADLPEEVFTIYLDRSTEHEVTELHDGKKCWLVFESEGAAEVWLSEQSEYNECEIVNSNVDTIEWMDLLVIRGPLPETALSGYIAISLVDGKLVRVPGKWVK